MRSFFLTSALAGAALAQGGPYAQCGGQGWTGSTTCVSGYTCTFSNEWYSQCLPGTGGGAPTTTLTTSTKTGTAPGPTSAPGKFKWFGINQSVAEFGEGKFPGVWGTDFYFPSDSTIQTLVGQGYNTFRVAFSMERMAPNKLTGEFDPAYLRNFTQTVNTITNAGAWAVIDPHNYGRYFGNIITNTQDFTAFWKTLATSFKSNSKVIFDTNNEYKEMDQTLVLNLNQAAIDAIRSVGATSQYIFAEGNAWSGAWSWNITNTNLVALKDPQNKLVYEMHQYLDTDSSGTHAECVSAEIGVQRLYGATKWLKENGKVGIIGEYAGGPNSQCQAAVKNMLDHMKANSDVWLGALWWAGGPWWADYMYSFEPPSGTAYTYYNSLLKNYLP